jgi:hypothetical protein
MTQKTETPICIRCLTIRYFIIAVAGLGLLAAIGGRQFDVIQGLTPMKIAVGMMVLGSILAALRLFFELRSNRAED